MLKLNPCLLDLLLPKLLYLNTSYVKVKRTKKGQAEQDSKNLNTSYVKVKQYI